MSWCLCKRCKRPIEFNDSVGYSRDFCGPLCDGIDAGRRHVIRAMLDLAAQLREKGGQSEEADIDLAFEAAASSIERVCREVME